MTVPLGPSDNVGSANIVFNADTKGLGADLQKNLLKSAKNAEPTLKEIGEDFAEAIEEGMEKGVSKPRFFQRIGGAIQRTFKREKVKVDVDVDIDTDSPATRRSIGRAVSNLASSFSQGIAKGFNTVLSSLGSSIGNVSSRGKFAAFIGGAIILLIDALIGAVAALLNVFGPLVNVVFALPAGLFTLVGAIAPVIVAFQGFGEAVGAIASGDLEAIDEALKNFGPNAKLAAKEVAGLLPWMRQLKLVSQESFFAGLIGIAPKLQATIGDSLVIGMEKVALAAGSFAASFLSVFASAQGSQFFNLLFGSSARLFSNLGGGNIQDFLDGLLTLSNATFPWIDKFTAALGGAISDFGIWLKDMSESGRVDQLLTSMTVAFAALMDLAGTGWNLLKAIIGGSGEDGRATEFLNLIIFVLDDMTKFFESELGETALKGMVTLAEALVLALAVVLAALFAIAAVAEILRSTFQAIGDGIVWLIQKTKELLGLQEKVQWLPPRLPGGAADGAIIDSPTQLMVGEGGNREVILPLTDPARTRELAMQSGAMDILTGGGRSGENNGGISFHEGAIQVNFQGNAVPSEQEAYRTGAAVGRGIQDLIAQRNVRLAVRRM